MAEFRKVASAAQLPPAGEAREFVLEHHTICIANENGCYSALDNVCPHQGGPLGEGIVEQGKVVCPFHGWQIDLKTGRAEQRNSLSVDVYEIKIDGDDVLVKL